MRGASGRGTVGFRSGACLDEKGERFPRPKAEFVVAAEGDERALEEKARGCEIGMHGLPPQDSPPVISKAPAKLRDR